MCGIAGFCDFKKKSTIDLLTKMTNSLSHRGPDDSGLKIIESPEATIGLGHRRLSIIDLSENGHQPMTYNHLSIIFNGEIYNFKALRQQLESKGYKFESTSDTEVILKGYDLWGLDVLDKLIGMFAIAIYDDKHKELILIRDRAGVKPFYYYWEDGLLIFSSEMKAIYQHPLFRKSLDFNCINLFLQYSYIPAPYTAFENTYKIDPGSYIRFKLGTRTMSKYSYWNIIDIYNRPKIHLSEEDITDQVEKLMISAYEYRMISDVPVGIFLSGGYDSTSVAALLQYNRTEKLKTFTIGYHESDYNEAKEAKKIAQYLGTDHHEWYVTAK